MEKIYLSKSKYCRAIQCNKMLWLDKNKPEERDELDKQAVLDKGTKVGELAKQLIKDMPKEEQEKVRYGLLKYCELDTYSMAKVWEKLKKI